MTPNQIEKVMLVPNYKTVYFVGCMGKGKITIHSQQIRAFNLAYALAKNNKLSGDKNIAIIGGGISGITIASAISQKCGCKIDIYESHQEVLDLQRKSDRYIHPNIFDWPIDGANNRKTALPFLNWEAGEVASVIKKMDSTWRYIRSLHSNITVYNQATVTNVEEIFDGKVVFSILTYKMKKIPEYSAYDYIIYAGGFGVEKPERSNFLSYWEKDKYESNVVFLEKKFKIYGAGDGGLIDCIRISLKNFDYQNLVEQFSENELFNKLGNDIKKREEIIKKEFENLEQELSDQELENRMSIALNDMYEKAFKPIFKELSATLIELYTRREKVSVKLFSRASYPYSLHSSLLNRVVVFFLLRNGIIEYQQVFDDDNYKIIRRIKLIISRFQNFFTKTVVIERFGPDRPYIRLFKLNEEDLKSYLLERLQLGIKKHWKNDFGN